jgi:WD40-like Beta Propeller Repeat
MVAAVAAAATLACSPQPGLGRMFYRRGTHEHVLDLATCREHVRASPKARPRGVFVSPDGRSTATVRVSGASETIRAGGTTLLTLPRWSPNASNGSPGPLMLLGWSGDSRWVFYAVDPMGSQSIIADGVQLRAVSLNGRSRAIAPALADDDYRAWCGGRLVLTAGGDRIAAHHKRLVTAAPPLWRTRSLVSGAGRAWGSLACAPDGHSVVVQSEPDAGTDMSAVRAHWSLWRVGPHGSQHRLTSPPAGYSDESPRFSRDGRTLFFVRSRKGVGALYALRSGRVLGPLASLGFRLGYYGHTDWAYEVAP